MPAAAAGLLPTSRGGEGLMALQNRTAMWGRTVVSNCYSDGGVISTPRADAERQAMLPAGPCGATKEIGQAAVWSTCISLVRLRRDTCVCVTHLCVCVTHLCVCV